MLKYTPYLLQAIDALVPGSGQASEGLADILITRESQWGHPIINGKALKGALKSHVADLMNGKLPFFIDHEMIAIFGSDREHQQDSKTNEDNKNQHNQEAAKKSQNAGHGTSCGRVVFQDAFLLALPLPGGTENALHRPVWITCHRAMANMVWTLRQWVVPRRLGGTDVTKELIEKLSKCLINIKNPESSFILYSEKGEDNILRDLKGSAGKLESNPFPLQDFIDNTDPMLPKDWALVNDDLFTDLCRQYLPIAQGNRVSDNGSDALYYYETLPRGTLFWTLLGLECGFVDTDNKLPNTYEKMTKALIKYPFQIGAKESTGHGHVIFRELGTIKEDESKGNAEQPS